MTKIFLVRSSSFGRFSGRRQRGAIMITALLLIVVLTLVAVSGMDNTVMEERMAGNFGQTISAQQAAEIALREAEKWIQADVHAAMFEKCNDTANGAGRDWNEFYLGSSSASSVIASTAGNVDGLYSDFQEPTCNYPTVFPCSAAPANCLFDPTEEADWSDPNKLTKNALTLGDTITIKDANLNPKSYVLPVIGNGSAVANQPKLIVEYLGSYEVGAKNVAVQNYQLPSARAKRYMFRITTMAWGRDGNARYVLQSNYQTPL